MRVGSSTTISDADLVTYNVKELNRVLKSKGITLTMVFMMMVMIQKDLMIVILMRMTTGKQLDKKTVRITDFQLWWEMFWWKIFGWKYLRSLFPTKALAQG